MKKYIECTLKENPSVVMNVKALRNIEYINKKLWNIKEKSAKELPHLHVFMDAKVSDNAIVSGNARVYGNAQVSGNARVFGNTLVHGDAIVFESGQVKGNAIVSGNAKVFGNAQVSGNAKVCGNAYVYEKSKVCGNALVYAHSELRGDAIATTKTYNIPFLQWNVTLSDNHISIGCKQWTYEQFLRLSEIHIGLEYSQEEYSEMIPAKDILIDAIKLKRPDLFKKEEK